jgi:Protein of unknown function (DUF2510)
MADNGPPQTPAQWASDPGGRHELRYWDGTTWTDQVSDRGVQATDPMDAPAPTQPVTPAPVAPPVAPAATAAGFSTPVPTGASATKAKKSWYKRPGIMIPLGLVALLVVAMQIASGSSSKNKTSAAPTRKEANTTAAPTTTKAPAATKTTPAATKTTAARAPAGPIFTQSGSGTATTATFKVPNNWDFAWSYDCSNWGSSGNFITENWDYNGAVSGNGNGGATDLDNQGVSQLGPGGQGVEHYHSGGNTKYMKVTSECNWTLTVTKA